MPDEWRLLYDGITEARHHFAVEEALARLVDEGHTLPTLRMRQVKPAVFVGVYQDTWSEVDVAYCQAHDIQIVRRMNGGGAVYQEMGSFCFSAIFQRDLFSQSEAELYRLFANPAVRTCSDYEIVTQFSGRNDLLVGERKIYGSAQFAWYGAFVQSGTFLVNMDFDIMERTLTPPALKFAGKSTQSIRERVTSLSREVGRKLETREVMDRFTKHAADVLGIQLVPGDLTPEEQALSEELFHVKYSTEAWNLGSRPEYQVTVADRSDEGVISLSADLNDKIIKKVRINADLLLSDRNGLKNLEHQLTECSISEATDLIQAAPLSVGIRETMLRLLVKLAQEVAVVSSKSKENQR
jgi:lipoate-protein ligase A